VGWAINSAMILLAAAAFFAARTPVTELGQAKTMLEPLLGGSAAAVFAVALLFAGVASSVTAGMAGGSIVAGLSGEPYDIRDNHTRLGVGITLALALGLIFFIGDPFRGLIVSQAVLSLQLPFTIFLLIRLTASRTVMGTHANSRKTTLGLSAIGLLVTYLNGRLLVSLLS
jgi:manganese transport protein